MRWLVVVVGCAAPPTAVVVPPSSPPPAPVFPQPFAFRLDGEPVRYDEPLPAPTTTAFDDVVVAKTGATPDPRLFRACAALATLPSIDPRAVELAWSWNGIIEQPVTPVVMRTDDPQELATTLGTLVGAHIGIGHDQGKVVVAVTRVGLTTAPFARVAPIDRGFVVDAKLEPGFTHPQVHVEWDDRSTLLSTPAVVGGKFSARVPCQGRRGHGRVSIIALAGGSVGSVVALFPVWCGLDPPRALTIDPLHDASGDGDPDHAAHRLFTLLQRERVTSGVPALVWDDVSAVSARKHAEDLRAIVASGGTGPQFHPANIVAASVVENMAIATSIDGAFAKLMAERQRRANAMSVDMTGSGVGVALGADGQVYVSQIFVRTPSSISPDVIATQLEERIHDADNGIRIDHDLSKIAREIAAGMQRGLDDDKLAWILLAGGDELKSRYVRLFSAVMTTVDLGTIDPVTLVTATKIDHIGIAVVQGRDPKFGDNTIWIITVMGRRSDI